MTIKHLIRPRLVLLLSLLALVPISAASAAAPQSQQIPINSTFYVPASPSTCSFDVVGTNVGFEMITTSVDQNGNTVMTFSVHAKGTFTNPATGQSVPFVIANTATVTPNTDGSATIVFVGLQGRVTIPGQGLIAASVGRIIQTFDQNGNLLSTTFQAGQFAVGPFPAVCPYLT